MSGAVKEAVTLLEVLPDAEQDFARCHKLGIISLV